MARPLHRVIVRGLTSLRDAEVELSTPVTVLIGANGAGKSNFVRSLELLGEIVDRRLQDTVARRGGFERLLHQPEPGGERTDHIVLEVQGATGDDGIWNGYRAVLRAGEDDEVVLTETLLMQDVTRYARPYEEGLGSSRESRLHKVGEEGGRRGGFARYVLDVLASCRVYHFDDVGHDAPPKRRSALGDDLELRRDGGNLAAYLHRLREDDPDAYARMVTAVRSVAPFFEDFVLEPQGRESDTLLLRWRQTSCEGVFSASQLSDGTLRFVCLATLLLSPDAPTTLVLDEPELGLHPFAIHQLAELVGIASRGGRRVVLATQSVPLLEEFDLESVVVVGREAGASTFTRPDAASLEAFVGDYSLGELWRMNLLGGRPSREGVSA